MAKFAGRLDFFALFENDQPLWLLMEHLSQLLLLLDGLLVEDKVASEG